jgi:hypothetical protein
MPRPKLPEEQVKETVGVKLTPDVIRELNEIADAIGSRPSAVGRELLLLGLAVYKGVAGSPILGQIVTISLEKVEPGAEEEVGLIFKVSEQDQKIETPGRRAGQQRKRS